MKHFKDINGEVFGYDDDYEAIPEGLIEITIQEARQIVESKIPMPTLQEKRVTARLTPMQFMLNVDAAGMMPAIEAYLAEPTTPNSFKIMWNRASSFERLYPDLVAAATELGITDAQMDAIFGIV